MARAAVLPPASPPKRVGRGRPRTRLVTSSQSETVASKTKKAATATAKQAATTEAKKRRGRPPKKVEVQTEVESEGTDDEIDTIEVKQRSKVTSSAKSNTTSATGGAKRGRKAATPQVEESSENEEDDDEDELALMDVEVPKKKGGRPRSKPASSKTETEGKSEAVPKRGRPKGTSTRKVQKDTTESSVAPKPIYIATGSLAMKSNLLRGPAKKKTVTFKDVSEPEEIEEEESLPAPTTTRRRRGTGVQEGMGAKPVRKPATPAPRGRKPAAGKKGAKPLSPKKATQVAKNYASSDGEEDELSGAKNQVKLVVDSPTKHGSETPRSISPVRRINFTPNKASKNVDENGEPALHPSRLVNFSDSVYMSSPARRPSESPFQYTMKETPRRGALNFGDGSKSVAQPNLSPIQDSPLKTSPKKANLSTSSMGIPQQPSFSPTNSPLKASPKKGTRSPIKGSLGPSSMSMSMPQPDFSVSSPLKTSPKKGKLGASFSQSQPPVQSMTPLTAKTSFIQSPAKKVPSPFKGSLSPRKLPAVGEDGSVDGERRESAFDGRVASESPEKTGTPQVDELEEEVSDETHESGLRDSPAVPESEMNPEIEAEPMAEDDAVTMIEEANAENEETADDAAAMIDEMNIESETTADKDTHKDAEEPIDSHVEHHADDQIVDQSPADVEDEVEDQVEGLEAELNLVDQHEEHLNDRVEELVENEQENVQPHSNYDTYGCDYLQAEVKDSIEEYQRQMDHRSELEEMDPDATESEPDGDDENENDVDMGQEESPVSETREPQSSRRTPIRMSIPDGFEDVFVDTPLREELNARSMGRDEAQTPSEEPPRLSLPDGFEDVFTETPKQEGTAENADMETNRESSPQLPGNSLEEPADRQVDKDDTVSGESDVEEDKENTPMPLDEPEEHMLRSDSVSSDSSVDLEELEQMTIQGPNCRQIEQDIAHYNAQNLHADVEETPMKSDEHELHSPAPRPSLLHEMREMYEATTQHQESHQEAQSNTPLDEPPLYPVLKGETAVFRDHGRLSMESSGDSTSVIDTQRLESATKGGRQTPAKGSLFGKRRSIFEKFTPLADQFSQWKTTSPIKSEPQRPRRRGLFSLGGELRRPSTDISRDSDEVSYPDISNHPMADTQALLAELPGRESMASAIYEDKEQEPEVPQENTLEPAEMERQPMSEIFSDAEHETGVHDARETPFDQIAHFPNQEVSPTRSVHSVHDEQDVSEKENAPASAAVPAAPATPMANKVNLTHTLHTVSKVPLKPEGEVSPLKILRKRGRSLGNTSPVRSSPRLQKSSFSPKRHDERSDSPRKMPRLEPKSPRRRSSHARTENKEQQQTEHMDTAPSPVKSPRKSLNACSQSLQGAVVHVDVHTTEGEDASGIFIELLQQMGAKCVRNWAWNPRSSLSPVDGEEPKEGRVGISHVVFKDGGVRTLEKVRQAGGLVKCVGVGWVLE